MKEDTTTRVVGLEVLDALAHSEYASEHESEVIDAAVAPTLEAYLAQLSEVEPALPRGPGAEAAPAADSDE